MDYYTFFTNVVAEHLHTLVNLVGESKRKKVLLHQWILGIEKNWSEYIEVSDDQSEFIPRLSFWIGGLREKFKAHPRKKEVIKLINETFDASTFCFFEYGARGDILKQIEKYVQEVDSFFGEDILTHRLKKFKLSRKIVKIVNNALDNLRSVGITKEELDNLKVSQEINDVSDLEKEFNKLMDKIINLFLEKTKYYSKKSVYMLKEFLEECKEAGYPKTILYLKVINIVGIPIKKLTISVRSKNKEITKKTNNKGEVLFLDLPKTEINFSLKYRREKKFKINIKESINRKCIWLKMF